MEEDAQQMEQKKQKRHQYSKTCNLHCSIHRRKTHEFAYLSQSTSDTKTPSKAEHRQPATILPTFLSVTALPGHHGTLYGRDDRAQNQSSNHLMTHQHKSISAETFHKKDVCSESR